jgi:type IV pilus assembly protein PilQ
MKTTWKALYVFMFLTLLLAGSCVVHCPRGAEAAENEDALKLLPPIGGLTVQQLGSHAIVMQLLGASLPRPEITSNTSDLIVFTVQPAYLASVKWERQFELPLVQSVYAEQKGEAVVFNVRINGPLVLKDIEGVAPANRYFLRFSAAGHVAREREAPALKAPLPTPPTNYNDPFTRTTPITLDLRDVELRDVFRMIGEYAGMNMLTDPSVPNTLVTMTLKSVPLNEALGYILRMYDLGYSLMGKTIVVGSPESIAKTTGTQTTRSFRVAYADMKVIAGLVQSLAGVSNIVADERLRTLYVTGRPAQFAYVERVLQEVDHPGHQVMLQARIIEVTDSGRDQLETIIDAVYNQWWLNFSSGGMNLGYLYADQPDSYKPGDERPAPGIDDGLESIAKGDLTKMLDFGLNSIVTANKGKVLADPSIITLDGKKAVIKLVENYPYISERDQAGNPTWSEKEVGPILEFTPTVGRDNMVTVELKIQTGEIIGTYRGQAGEEFPQTSNREVTTMIRVRDGEPFVVGGLHKDVKRTERGRVPILSNIPLLGELFKYRKDVRDKSEVAMIVIPYILTTPDGPVEQFTLK